MASIAALRLGWRVATGLSRHGFVWLTDTREPPPEVLGRIRSRSTIDWTF